MTRVNLERTIGTLAVIVGLMILPVVAAGDIASTAHNFSSLGWSGGEICIACHTPHDGSTTSLAPLWNHEETTATFTVYSSGTIDADGGTIGQPNGISKMCLSCHDGSVALDSFGGASGSTFLTGADAGFVGLDLSNDHPISITYDTALSGVDNGLHDPSSTTSGLGGNVDTDMLFGAGNDQLECASCHDPHGVPGVAKLLRKSNANSDLCLTCHDK